MNFAYFRTKYSLYSLSFWSTIFFSLITPTIVSAETFSDQPLFSGVNSFTTRIANGGNSADIYFPFLSATEEELFPTAILLPGALVDKSFYVLIYSMMAMLLSLFLQRGKI